MTDNYYYYESKIYPLLPQSYMTMVHKKMPDRIRYDDPDYMKQYPVLSVEEQTITGADIKTALPYNTKKKASYWTRKMFPKYNLFTEHFNITNTELYKNLYREMQNTYPDVDLNQLQEDYCYENKLNSCYTLDAIEHTPKIRILFESIVDNILDQHGLSLSDPTETKYKTIF